MTMRTYCGGCRSTRLRTFLDLGSTPLANTFPASVDTEEKWYPLQLAVCEQCKLVQQLAIIDDAEIYGDDYGFYSGGSEAQRRYHAAGARALMHRHPELAKKLTVEVACNDGSLLAHFQEAGCRAVGIDPAAPALVAQKTGLDVHREWFSEDYGKFIRQEYGPAGLVIAYNSLAHVGDLPNVLRGVAAMMDTESRAIVEVQYLPDLLTGNMYDQIYHEHRYFYSLTSFANVAQVSGLYVRDAELIELQGGGIRFTLSTEKSVGMSDRAIQIMAREQWSTDPDAYPAVQGRIDRARDHLVQIVEDYTLGGLTVAGYAAAAKATTILNYAGFGPDTIPYVVDSTPYKQGRFVPGTKIPIVAEPPELPDAYLLLAPNYLSQVLRNHRSFLDGGGHWIMPVPMPVSI